MAWRRRGDKPLSEPMMVSLLTHICVTRPQWVNLSREILNKIKQYFYSNDILNSFFYKIISNTLLLSMIDRHVFIFIRIKMWYLFVSNTRSYIFFIRGPLLSLLAKWCAAKCIFQGSNYYPSRFNECYRWKSLKLRRVSKMNAVARAQLTFQMLTLLQKYLYHQSQCSKHGTRNVWPW